jgi:hypothetical protein
VFRRTDLGSWKEPNETSELLLGGNRPRGRFALHGPKTVSAQVGLADYFSVFGVLARFLRYRIKASVDRKNTVIKPIWITNSGRIGTLP